MVFFDIMLISMLFVSMETHDMSCAEVTEALVPRA